MNHAWLLERHTRWIRNKKDGPIRIAELGSGDGSLACRLLKQWGPVEEGSQVIFVDQAPCLEKDHAQQLTELGWQIENQVMDVFQWAEKAPPDIDLCFASLFIHHFSFQQIGQLFQKLSRHTKAFLCLEPRRDWKGLIGAKALCCLRCHPITLNDALISVQAGFRHKELSHIADGNFPPNWERVERPVGPFSHLFLTTCFQGVL